MAFATDNVRRAGTVGSLKFLVGDWSANEGDAQGTIDVEGGRVYAVLFTSQDTTGALRGYPVNWTASSPSGSTKISTVTVRHFAGVTTGRFLIVYS